MKIIDMHCDTIKECFLRNEGLRNNSLCVNLEKMKKNNAAAQFLQYGFPCLKIDRKKQTAAGFTICSLILLISMTER